MKKVNKILCIIMVFVLVFAFTSIAYASQDTAPYQSWSQFRLLKSGKAGNDVRFLQQFMKMQGRLSSDVDGAFGSDTKAAVKSYQHAKGLSEDSEVGTATWSRMYRQAVQCDIGPTNFSYFIEGTVGNWDKEDRFLHRYGSSPVGSWWVQYGNSYNSWSSAVCAWEP